MDLGLRGVGAFVAGGSSGIGRAIAETLLNEGARVAVCARNREKLESALRALAPRGVVRAIAADLDGPEAERAVTDAIVQLGSLGVLVCNGGGPRPGAFAALTDEDWKRAHESLVLSTVRMVRAAEEALAASGRGRIVIIASTSVKQPIAHLMLSNSLRLAVVGLAKSLSVELAKKRITVNVVCPGMTNTERLRELDEAQAKATGRTIEEVSRARTGAIPLARLADPSEIAAAAAFFASSAASYVTGTVLAVDGGLVHFPL